MKQLKLYLIFGLISILSACAFHGGVMTGNALISDGDFQVVGFAIGSSSATKVLGLGGTKKEFLVLEAKRDLYAHNSLKRGQALSNVTVDFCNKNYILFSKLKVTVSAEIVDFLTPYDSLKVEGVYEILKSRKIFERNGFQIGEKVYYKKGFKYELGTIQDLHQSKVVIELNDSLKQEEYSTLKYSDLFKIKKREEIYEPNYHIDDNIVFKKVVDSLNEGDEIDFVGKIKCIGYNKDYIVSFYFSGELIEEIVNESSIIKNN